MISRPNTVKTIFKARSPHSNNSINSLPFNLHGGMPVFLALYHPDTRLTRRSFGVIGELPILKIEHEMYSGSRYPGVSQVYL